jgi:hypothetical protein
MLIIREAVDRYDEQVAALSPEDDEDPNTEGAPDQPSVTCDWIDVADTTSAQCLTISSTSRLVLQ